MGGEQQGWCGLLGVPVTEAALSATDRSAEAAAMMVPPLSPTEFVRACLLGSDGYSACLDGAVLREMRALLASLCEEDALRRLLPGRR